MQAYGFDIHAGAAKNWPQAALLLGYEVDNEPRVGDAMITKESSYGTNTGHGVLVLEVHEDYLLVKEQNYIGPYIVSTREIRKDSWIYQSAVFIHQKNV